MTVDSTYFAFLIEGTTVSCHGLDITIACDDHDTRDKLMNVLTESAPGNAGEAEATIRLEARPADDSQEWTEIFPAQLEWAAKQGHQVRAIESAPTPAALDPVEVLAAEFTKWVEQYALKVCPEGCLPTPGQEREINLFARVVLALSHPESLKK